MVSRVMPVTDSAVPATSRPSGLFGQSSESSRRSAICAGESATMASSSITTWRSFSISAASISGWRTNWQRTSTASSRCGRATLM